MSASLFFGWNLKSISILHSYFLFQMIKTDFLISGLGSLLNVAVYPTLCLKDIIKIWNKIEVDPCLTSIFS